MAITRQQGSTLKNTSTPFNSGDTIWNGTSGNDGQYDSGSTGSRRIIVLYLAAEGNSSGSPRLDVANCTYNSVAFTEVAWVGVSGTRRIVCSMAYVVAPATGSNDLVVQVTGGGGTSFILDVEVWSDVSQTTPFPENATDNRTATTPVMSLTTTVANSALLMLGGWQDGNTTATIDGVYTERTNATTGTSTTQDNGMVRGDRIVSSTGTYTEDFSLSASQTVACILAAMAEDTGGGSSSSPAAMLMGL